MPPSENQDVLLAEVDTNLTTNQLLELALNNARSLYNPGEGHCLHVVTGRNPSVTHKFISGEDHGEWWASIEEQSTVDQGTVKSTTKFGPVCATSRWKAAGGLLFVLEKEVFERHFAEATPVAE